jgi:putative CocE/NonD family hydrolase
VPTSRAAQDQSEVEKRSDVLVYTTAPLKTGIEVTGPLEVMLVVGSSARDTDFTAKLVDVYPDGAAFNIQEGILRARYREGFNKKVWMKPGEAYPLRIDLHATSNYFPPGHRIRLEISSSNFPRFDRNLNTGGNNYDETETVVAENFVYHTKNQRSYIGLLILTPVRSRNPCRRRTKNEEEIKLTTLYTLHTILAKALLHFSGCS